MNKCEKGHEPVPARPNGPCLTCEIERANASLSGPTLRDQFAMAALTGLLISSKAMQEYGLTDEAYKWADAMMAVRTK